MARDSGRGGGKKKFSKTLILPPCRMAFPALFEPETNDNGDERYKMTCLFPPKSDLKALRDTMFDAIEDGFGTDEKAWPKGRNDILPDDKLYHADDKNYTGFKEGWMALAISSKDPPGIVDADRQEVLSKREVYGGRWCRVQVNVTWYDEKSKGVGVYLNHVQLLEHDEAFSGRGEAKDAFDKYELRDDGREPPRGRDRDDRDEPRRGRDRDEPRGRDRDDRDEAPREARGGRDRDEPRRGRDEAPRGRDDAPRGRDDRDRDEPRRGRDRDDPPRVRVADRDEPRRGRDRDDPPRVRAPAADEWN